MKKLTIAKEGKGNLADIIYKELSVLLRDKKMLSCGGVVQNKNARHNNIIADENIEPCIEEGQGTVISFEKMEYLSCLREKWGRLLGSECNKLYAEVNYYYDPKKTYIGFHGARFGADFSLYYQRFHKNSPIGDLFTLVLNHGDIYIMSDKAVGFDWKKSSILTLRYAAGAVPKMPSIKVKSEDNRCIATKKNGDKCTNLKKFDEYCGVHKK